MDIVPGAVGFFQRLVYGFRDIGSFFSVLNWRLEIGSFSVGFLDLLLPVTMLSLVGLSITLHIVHLVSPLG